MRVPFRRILTFSRPFLVFAVTAVTFMNHTPVQADEVASFCVGGECQPVITDVTYFDRPAYRLTDGHSEAIVVPAIGRIMRFAKVGGENVLWNAPTSKGIDMGWINYGGDKNWLAPQSDWKVMTGSAWPPDTAFDGQPQEAEVLTGGKLKLTSPLSTTGIRYSRVMYFNTKGEFVIEQTAKKEQGQPLRAAIWSITQAVPGEAIYAPTNPYSPYKGNYFQFQGNTTVQPIETFSPNLLRFKPVAQGGGVKFGFDSPVSSIASVHNGTTFLLKTARPKGTYPDGATGFPVELYINGDSKAFYCELEILAPLQNFYVGTSFTHTMRWSLHDTTSPEAIEALLKTPTVTETPVQ